MKYHVVPMQKSTKRNRALTPMIRKTAAGLENEAVKSIKALTKEETSQTLYYLADEKSMLSLMKKINNDDELILHGEGQAFVIGLEEPSDFDLNPFSLAKYLYQADMPDININIRLLACHSATTYAPSEDKATDLNFARDTSKSLGQHFKYEHITVTGYTGFIVVKNSGKYSVSSVIDGTKTDKKRTHGSLEQASMVYKSGELISKGVILSENYSDMAFGWAKPYITAYKQFFFSDKKNTDEQDSEKKPTAPTPLTPSA
jgi:hypothetical protein